MAITNKIFILETDLVFDTQREREHALFTKSSEAISAFKKRVEEIEEEIKTRGIIVTDITNKGSADLTPYIGKYIKNVCKDEFSIYVLGEYNNKHVDVILYSYRLPVDKTTSWGLTKAKLHTRI